MAKPSPYPVVPGRNWYTLRDKAKTSPNTKLNAANVASILGLPEASAQNNVLRGLRSLGVVDDQGSLSATGEKWRVDGSYDDACKEILEAVYPEDLRLLIGKSVSDDRDSVQAWFARKGFGDSSARQMAATFQLLAHPTVDSPKSTTNGTTPKASTPKASTPKPSPAKSKSSSAPAAGMQPPEQPASHRKQESPNVHLDIQIHIPASASTDQIDSIFASMAKHLYGR